MKPITIEEMLALSRKEFVARNLEWMKEFNNGEYLIVRKKNEKGEWVDDPLSCPLHQYVVYNHLKCSNELVSLTAFCPLCGNPCCPDCMNHKVEQLSRVTGYMAPVSGYNEGKKQEFKDRQRYTL